MKHVFVLAALFVVLAEPARADFTTAMSAYERKDYGSATAEFQVLADQGDADAQFMLGYLYTRGEGVLQNYVQAHKWFNLAASQGKEGARKARDDVAKRMTPLQVAEAQRLASEWQPKPVEAEPRVLSEKGATEVAASAAGMSREEIAKIQAMLTELGYGAGVADGLVGEKTRLAIRSYQADAGLPVDGEPSRDLMNHLTDVYTARKEQEPPRAKLVEKDAVERERDRMLVERLHKLVIEGERRGARRRWFLNELWGLVREYEGPWRHRLLLDTFLDRDYTTDPTWSAVVGEFVVEKDIGLHSTVTAPVSAPESSEIRTEDLARSILGAILEESAPRDAEEKRQAMRDYAEIHVVRKLSNAFALLLVMTSREKVGGVEFGVYQGSDRGAGYRIAYIPGAQKGIELLRVSSSGSAVVGVYAKPLDFEDEKPHVVEWTRDPAGKMIVSADGIELLQVTDRRFRGSFDGFTVVNHGGDYGVRTVMIFGVEPTP